MDAFAATGLWGWAILLLTPALLLASLVCAAVRVQRGVAIVLLLASLLPLFVGLSGMAHGRAAAHAVIATLAAPTPGDLAVGTYESEGTLMLGLAATLFCWVAALVSLARSRDPEPEPGLAAA